MSIVYGVFLSILLNYKLQKIESHEDQRETKGAKGRHRELQGGIGSQRKPQGYIQSHREKYWAIRSPGSNREPYE